MIELLLASGGSNRLIPFNLFKLILTLKTNLLQQVIMTTLEQNSLWQFQILSSNTFHMNEMTFRANWHLLQSGVKLNRRNEKKSTSLSHSWSLGLPSPGLQTVSLASPALEGRFFTTSTTWEASFDLHLQFIFNPLSKASFLAFAL